MATQTEKSNLKSTAPLWVALIIGALGTLFARVLYPEIIAIWAVFLITFVVSAGLLIQRYRTSVSGRTAAFGLNSLVTIVLVLSIVGVLNFISYRYPQKLDLTKNKRHSLSDQTVKLVKGLKTPLKATYFAKPDLREQNRLLLENYKAINPKFELEFVDPDREPIRAKSANIRKYGTLHLGYLTKNSAVEDVSEEKITNALIKLLKEKSQTLCYVTGHGEKEFSGQEQEGLSFVKTAIENQSYTLKELQLLKEGKVPANCDAIAIMGPSKGFLKAEAQVVQDYLAGGGRAIIALDVDIKGNEITPELNSVVESWGVKPTNALIINAQHYPANLGPSASVLLLFSKESPITKDFKYQAVFPSARPLEINKSAHPELTSLPLGQTLPDSLALEDFKSLSSGKMSTTGKEKSGSMAVAVSVEGKLKDSKAAKNTRIVLFGTSLFAVNAIVNTGGNMDFFMNSAAWVLEDESLISIRAKDEAPSKIEMSVKQNNFVMLVTVILVPVLIALLGIIIWTLRRKL